MLPERHTIHTPITHLSYLEYGVRESSPVVMLHGLTDMALALDPIARHLAHERRVLSFDLRGHGDSGHPGQYAIANFVADLRWAIDALELERPVLIGHSLGSIVVTHLAALWPDEPRAAVLLEGLGPPPRVGEGTPEGDLAVARGLVTALSGDPTRRPMDEIDAAVERLTRAHPGLDAERLQALASEGTRPTDDGRRQWKFDPYVRDWITGHHLAEQRARWAGIACPTMVVSGSNAWEQWWKPTGEHRPGPPFDGPLSEAERETRLALFGDVEHHVVEAGHMVHFDAPAEVSSLIADFLGRRAPI